MLGNSSATVFLPEPSVTFFCSLTSILSSPPFISTSSVPESVLEGMGYFTFFAGNRVLLMNSVIVDFPDSLGP